MKEEAACNLDALKAGGLMKQKEPDLFSVRLRVVGGRVEARELRALADLAERYGRGHVHLTTRQGVEIPYVHFRDIDRLQEELEQFGMELGACGPRVRTVTACQGLSCSNGLIDAQKLAKEVDEMFYGRSGLPHKFKVAITGCLNSCIKPQENDIGLMGIVQNIFHPDRCTTCGLCVHACPGTDVLSIEDDELKFNEEKCLHCRACIAVCPQDAWEEGPIGYAVFVGGKMGKHPKLGKLLPFVVTGEKAALEIIARSVDWYEKEGKQGERFGEVIDRVGFEKLVQFLA